MGEKCLKYRRLPTKLECEVYGSSNNNKCSWLVMSEIGLAIIFRSEVASVVLCVRQSAGNSCNLQPLIETKNENGNN